jgi:hypothetical protein
MKSTYSIQPCRTTSSLSKKLWTTCMSAYPMACQVMGIRLHGFRIWLNRTA